MSSNRCPLLASEYKDPKEGIIDGSDEKLAFRSHRTVKEFSEAIKPLIKAVFIGCETNDSNALAACNRDATPETEKKTDTKEKDFDVFWNEYPLKKGKANALKAFLKNKYAFRGNPERVKRL